MGTGRPVVSSTAILQGALVDPKTGMLTPAGLKWVQGIQQAVNAGLDQNGNFVGSIDDQVIVIERGVTIGQLLENIDDEGVLLGPGIDFERNYLNKNTDNITDGTGHPLAGGKAAYLAFLASEPVLGDMLVFNGAEFVPVPSPAALAKQVHEWLDSYNPVTGEFTQSQPAFTDIAGQATPAQVPLLSALNGGVTGLQLPLPTTSLIGGVEAVNAIAHEWIASIDTSGVPHLTQPAAADLSNGTTGSGGGVVLATSPTIASPSLSSPGISNGLIGTGASTIVAALATATVLAGSGAISGILTLRDNTLGGSAVFLIDPNAGAQLIGASQITGLTASADIVWNGTNWTVTLTAGAVPRTLTWIILGN